MATVITQEIKQAWTAWLQNADVQIDSELSCGLTAQDWLDEGLYPSERENCLAAGAFNPESCSELLIAEIDLDEASRQPTDAEIEKYDLPYSGYSLAYMHSNGDLSLDDFQEMIG